MSKLSIMEKVSGPAASVSTGVLASAAGAAGAAGAAVAAGVAGALLPQAARPSTMTSARARARSRLLVLLMLFCPPEKSLLNAQRADNKQNCAFPRGKAIAGYPAIMGRCTRSAGICAYDHTIIKDMIKKSNPQSGNRARNPEKDKKSSPAEPGNGETVLTRRCST